MVHDDEGTFQNLWQKVQESKLSLHLLPDKMIKITDNAALKSYPVVTTQSTSSSALQAFPYSDAIMKRPE